MEKNKFLATLGLARKAGKLTYGFDMTVGSLKKVYLIFFANDISDKTKSEIEYHAKDKIPLLNIKENKESLGKAIGTKPVAIIGVLDKGFADSFLKILNDQNNGKNVGVQNL